MSLAVGAVIMGYGSLEGRGLRQNEVLSQRTVQSLEFHRLAALFKRKFVLDGHSRRGRSKLAPLVWQSNPDYFVFYGVINRFEELLAVEWSSK